MGIRKLWKLVGETVCGPEISLVLTRLSVHLIVPLDLDVEPPPPDGLKELLGRETYRLYNDGISRCGWKFLPRHCRSFGKGLLAYLDGNPEVPFVWVSGITRDGYCVTRIGDKKDALGIRIDGSVVDDALIEASRASVKDAPTPALSRLRERILCGVLLVANTTPKDVRQFRIDTEEAHEVAQLYLSRFREL